MALAEGTTSTSTATSASASTTAVNSNNSNLVSVSVFDLLLIELIPLAERMAIEYEASLDRPSAANRSFTSSSYSSSAAATAAFSSSSSLQPPKSQPQLQNHPPPSSSSSISNSVSAGAGPGPGPAATIITTSTPPPSSITPTTTAVQAYSSTTSNGQPITPLMRELISQRLDALGYRVGLGLSERFSRDRPRFVDHLDVIKFLCKDLWTVVWKKQIDNLKTNHRGVFVLTDAKFRPLSRMSMVSSAEAVARAQVHLIFPCGIIRGVLASLGIQATVQAESTELPTATFQIKTGGSKG